MKEYHAIFWLRKQKHADLDEFAYNLISYLDFA